MKLAECTWKSLDTEDTQVKDYKCCKCLQFMTEFPVSYRSDRGFEDQKMAECIDASYPPAHRCWLCNSCSKKLGILW